MSTINTISIDKFLRLAGTPNCPALVDVRNDAEFAADAHLVPSSVRRRAESVAEWGPEFAGRNVIVLCRSGAGLSPGTAAWLRHEGAEADVLEGGFDAWKAAGHALVPDAKLPPRNAHGRTVWVTRARPKVDRIACPWLIRRFVDPDAVFLYVAPSEVPAVAEKFRAAPFDIEGEGVFWSHQDERCTFDVMVDELGLGTFGALKRLAVIVRGADTGHPEVAPEAAGLLAASLGLSRMYADDLEQLEAGMLLYDSFYRWCRDATDETHNWVSHKPSKPKSPR
jgi:rhodanese-related sulfurtransferase